MFINFLDRERNSFDQPVVQIGQGSVAVELYFFQIVVILEKRKSRDLSKVISLLIFVNIYFCQFDYIDRHDTGAIFILKLLC